MNVICINDKWVSNPAGKHRLKPKFGEKYCVTDTKHMQCRDWYALQGFSGDWFLSECFAPIDGPDMSERDEAFQRKQLAAEGKLLEGVAAILAEEENMPQDVWERNWAAIEERLNTGR